MKRGFSLIELLIVLGIIGIISVIAVPTYQTYVKRVKTAEVVKAASLDLLKLGEYILANGVPTSATKVNTMMADVGDLNVCNFEYVDSSLCTFYKWGLKLRVSSKVTSIPFHFHMVPKIENNSIVWICGRGGGLSEAAIAEAEKLLPDQCKGYIVDKTSSLW